MASYYVYSGATGAGTGADWTNAFTTLAAANTASAAGDVFYVANDHAETQGSAISITFKGVAATPTRVLCVNRAGSVPPVAADLTTGGSISTTGAFGISFAGNYYIYGLALNAGTSGATNISLAGVCYLDTCAIALGGSTGNIAPGGGYPDEAKLVNTTVSFANAAQYILTSAAPFRWKSHPGSAAILGAAVPSSLFNVGGSTGPVTLSGIDLSALGSGKTIIGGAGSRNINVMIANCKLGTSVTIAGTPTTPTNAFDLVNCSSGSAGRFERYTYMGTLTTETTIIRTGGASDGVAGYSWKIVPTANNEHDFPFICDGAFEGYAWNTSTGSSKTLSIHVVTDGVTLNDDEIWVEVDYLGSSATPVYSTISDGNANVLTAGAAQATSTAAWTTTGLTSPVYQKLDVTFTPQMVGLIRWRIKYAKTSTTVYVCPKAEIV